MRKKRNFFTPNKYFLLQVGRKKGVIKTSDI